MCRSGEINIYNNIFQRDKEICLQFTPRGFLIVGLQCSADFASCMSYKGESSFHQAVRNRSTSLSLCAISPSATHTLLWFRSWVHLWLRSLDLPLCSGSHLWAVTTCMNMFPIRELNYKMGSRNTCNILKLLVDIRSMRPGSLKGIWSQLSVYTYCMGIELFTADSLLFRESTPMGLHCTKTQLSHTTTKKSWVLNRIDAKTLMVISGKSNVIISLVFW